MIAHLAHGHDEWEYEGDEHEVEEAGGAVCRTKSSNEIRRDTVHTSSTAAAREEVGCGIEDVASCSTGARVRLVGRQVAHWVEWGGAGAELQKVADMSVHI